MNSNVTEGLAYLALASQGRDNAQFSAWISRALAGEGSYADLAALWPLAVRR